MCSYCFTFMQVVKGWLFKEVFCQLKIVLLSENLADLGKI